MLCDTSADNFLVFKQLILMDSAITESDEVTEQGKPHISPRIVQEAICVLTCVPGLETDSVEAENLAQKLLVLASHPLVGKLIGASLGKLNLNVVLFFQFITFL